MRSRGFFLVLTGMLAAGLAIVLLLPAEPTAQADAGAHPPHAALASLEAGHTHPLTRAASHLGAAAASGGAGAAAEPDAIVPTPLPEQWLTTRRWPCRRYHEFAYCDGPLRVAKPHGEAAKRAAELGLGTLQCASHLLRSAPEPSWVAAVGSEPRDTLRWPAVSGRLGRGFGRVHRIHAKGYTFHPGVDIEVPVGTHVLAVNDGIVAYAYNQVKGYGNLIMLVHADGTISMYAHLRAAYVFPGQRVVRGQVIGESGETGLARGPHLHFEWRVHGRPHNPVRRFVDVPPGQADRFPRGSLARLAADGRG